MGLLDVLKPKKAALPSPDKLPDSQGRAVISQGQAAGMANKTKADNEKETKLFGGGESQSYKLAELIRQTLVRKEDEEKMGQGFKNLTEDMVNYIIRQYNDATFRGTIKDHQTYRIVLHNSVMGMFKLVYLEHYNLARFKQDGKDVGAIDLTRHDVLFASGFNLLIMLISRVKDGRDTQVTVEELRAKTPATYAITH